MATKATQFSFRNIAGNNTREGMTFMAGGSKGLKQGLKGLKLGSPSYDDETPAEELMTPAGGVKAGFKAGSAVRSASGGRGIKGMKLSDTADASENTTVGTKRPASTAGYAGKSYKPAPAPEKSAMMSATVNTNKKPATGVTSMTGPRKSQDWEASRDRLGDYYLQLSGGFGSDNYKKPKKR